MPNASLTGFGLDPRPLSPTRALPCSARGSGDRDVGTAPIVRVAPTGGTSHAAMPSDKQVSDAFHLYAGSAGQLDAVTLALCLRGLGYTPTDKECRSAAGSGVSLGKLISICQTLTQPSADDNEALTEAFRVFDKTGSGNIPAKEFVQYGKILGETFSDKEGEDIMKLSHNGALQFYDLVKKMSA